MAKELGMQKVFLSSTNDDVIRELRLAAKSLIIQVYQGYLQAVEMGDFGPASDTPLSVSKAKVIECQFYVAMIGALYGSTPPEDPERSYTEIEFDTALEHQLDMMVYLFDANAHIQHLPQPYTYVREHAASLERQARFRSKIEKSGIVVDYVQSRDEFISKLNRHLTQKLFEQFGQIEKPSTTSSVVAVSSFYQGASSNSSYINAVVRLEKAAPYVADGHLVEQLKYPQREIVLNFPLRMDDGTSRNLTAFRVYHSTALGPSRGGLMFHPNISLEEIRAEAMASTWQYSLFQLPFGGAKGGIIVNPSDLSHHELERLSRTYTLEMINELSPDRDIISPDLGTTPQVVSWIMHTYSRAKGFPVPNVVTGKPIQIGGSRGLVTDIAQSISWFVNSANKYFALPGSPLRVVIQGFGSVGGHTASQLSELGHRVIAVSDFSGGVYNPDGLPIGKLLAHTHGKGSPLRQYSQSDVDHITQDEMFELDCDVIIPAAVSAQINNKNAAKLRAKMIVEGANYACTPEADTILEELGIIVVPDILANAGRALVSYLAQTSDITPDMILARMYKQIETALLMVEHVMEQYNVSMRTAAQIQAASRVIQIMNTLGSFP